MKITTEHYNHMATSIGKLDINSIRLAILNADRQPKDFDKRLRWDCMYQAGLSSWVCDNLYSYLDDSHIDTALKSIVKQIESARVVAQ